jgi:hypothetical protein
MHCLTMQRFKPALAPFALFALLPLSPARAQTIDELYEKAKAGKIADVLHRRGCGRRESDRGGL